MNKEVLDKILYKHIGEPNTPELRKRICEEIYNIIRNEKIYTIICNSENNQDE